MTDRERWEDLGCGDGACVFRTPTGMHTNGGCKCVPRTVDYDTTERSRLRRWVMVMRDRIVDQEREMKRLRQERRDALSVRSKDGLLASEWILRTGRAERELAEARARVEELEGREQVLLNIARFTDDYLNGRSEAMKPWELREAVRHALKTLTAEDPAHD